jgi:hypothetical protein
MFVVGSLLVSPLAMDEFGYPGETAAGIVC